MDSEFLEKEYNELLYGFDAETAEKFRKFKEFIIGLVILASLDFVM